MCGIVGFNWKSENEEIEKLNNSMIHRGPDSSGTFVDEKISFGQRRLAIIDISDAGHQPMFYSKNLGATSKKHNPKQMYKCSTSIVFNGEIYNYVSVREELMRLGYKFTTASDTEVVMAAYSEWGTSCVKHFNGMWAFCIYDQNKNILFLSRDRLGQKPLYYYVKDNKFIFGSEMKVFYQAGIKPEIDNYSFEYYVLFSFSPNERSISKNIHKLPPAHNLIYDLEKSCIKNLTSYWTNNFTNNNITFKSASQKIRQLLEDSVKLRMIADVPVGAFLSGGVDSSVIVSIMRKHVNKLKTFSVGFDYDDFNESKWALSVARHFNTEHHEIQFTAEDVLELAENMPVYFDEPFADASMIPTYLVSKVARKHVTVCLSGTGADELFGGYDRYSEYFLLRKILKIPKIIISPACFLYSLKSKDKAGKLKQLLNSQNDAELYIRLFSPMFRSENEISVNLDNFKHLQDYLNSKNYLTKVLSFDQAIYLPGDLLVKEDRATMAHSLEGRIPFLDYRLIEFANSLPSRFKIKNGTRKFILKEIFKDNLPSQIMTRKKQGFGVPLRHYFRNELKDYAYDTIFNSDENKYFDVKILKYLWDKHQSQHSDYSPLFWKVIMFNKWREKWGSL